MAFREIAAETSSIVRYCQNTIGYSLWSLTSRFRSWLLIAHAVSAASGVVAAVSAAKL